jgi:hypothetical protein
VIRGLDSKMIEMRSGVTQRSSKLTQIDLTMSQIDSKGGEVHSKATQADSRFPGASWRQSESTALVFSWLFHKEKKFQSLLENCSTAVNTEDFRSGLTPIIIE